MKKEYVIIYHNVDSNEYGSLHLHETGIHAALKEAKEALPNLLSLPGKTIPIYQLYKVGTELPLWESEDCPSEIRKLE